MLLFHVKEWYGKGRNCPAHVDLTPEERSDSYVTRLSFSEAFNRLYKYQDAYNRYFIVGAINLTILGVSEIPDLMSEQLETANLILIEELKQKPEDFRD